MKILRKREVIDRTGLSAPTIWRKERDGEFPPRIQVSPQIVGWLESDIDEWIKSRVRGIPAAPQNIIAA